jgi:serine/threonine protein kinase
MELRTAIGTPYYVAPEVVGVYSVDSTQSVDQAYSFLVDIWSAGAIAFRMLTSQHAFSDRWQLFNYVVHGKPFPSQCLTGFSVSQVCVDFIQQAMAASPKKRPSAAESLAHPWIQTQFSISDLAFCPRYQPRRICDTRNIILTCFQSGEIGPRYRQCGGPHGFCVEHHLIHANSKGAWDLCGRW